ncbi:MAG TPA: hypothetical protein VM142_05250 [Acidimicrobiales bacterium]|nr:hypothetical protein [Acidimicrobiales bacterium]
MRSIELSSRGTGESLPRERRTTPPSPLWPKPSRRSLGERTSTRRGKQLQASCISLPEDPALARLADAYDTRAGETTIDWTRLRGFIDWLRLHPHRIEEAIETPAPRTDPLLDALLAGIAEKLAADAGLVTPRWTRSVPPLPRTWAPPGTPRMIARAEKATPEAFRRRNIILAEADLWRPCD